MLSQPLTLPCGAVVPNRMCKAAMTEGLAHPDGTASAELERLYGIWSDGGSGILLSGNIQVDGDHLERPGNVICLLYTSPSPRDQRGSRMPSSA